MAANVFDTLQERGFLKQTTHAGLKEMCIRDRHKVINCFEHDMPMDVEHARQNTRLHPRCGTSFLLIVMIISILLFTLLGWSDNWAVRIGLRLAMLPIVAGVSYEVLKLLAKYENKFTEALRKPGMALQYLTTREPDDGMLEVALVSFLAAEDKKTDEEIDKMARDYSHKIDGSPADFADAADCLLYTSRCV